MAALATLSTTTLGAAASATDLAIRLVSTTDVAAGTRLWIDRELLAAVRVGVDGWVDVRRGVDGTAASLHAPNATVTIGRADQFFDHDPVGVPPAEVLVDPWINVITGDTWKAEGDSLGDSARYWTKRVTTRSTGALGVQTVTTSP